MEMDVRIDCLGKSLSVDVSYNDTFKSARNRSYSNASPFADKATLVQKKFCSMTGKEVTNDMVTHKLVKIGKEYIVLPVEKLKEIQENIEASATEIKVKAVVKREGFELPYERVEGSKWLKPAKKRARDYIELRELCETHILIGEATFKSNSYEVAMVGDGDDGILLVKFASQDRMTEKPDLDGLQGMSINPELIKLERDLLDKNSAGGYDFAQFTDARQEQEDKLIEEAAFGKVDLSAKPSEPAKAIVDDESELERLKKLLGTPATTASV